MAKPLGGKLALKLSREPRSRPRGYDLRRTAIVFLTLAAAGLLVVLSRLESSSTSVAVAASSAQASPAPQSPPAALRVRPKYVPAGFVLSGDSSSQVSLSAAGETAQRQEVLLRKTDSSGRPTAGITITVMAKAAVAPATAREYLGRDPRAELTTVRGGDAAVIAIDGGRGGAMLYWREGEASIQVIGRGVARTEVQKVAEGLEAI